VLILQPRSIALRKLVALLSVAKHRRNGLFFQVPVDAAVGLVKDGRI
jgi:hypothetical protein